MFVRHLSSSTASEHLRRSLPSTVKWWTCESWVVTAGLRDRPRSVSPKLWTVADRMLLFTTTTTAWSDINWSGSTTQCCTMHLSPEHLWWFYAERAQYCHVNTNGLRIVVTGLSQVRGLLESTAESGHNRWLVVEESVNTVRWAPYQLLVIATSEQFFQSFVVQIKAPVPAADGTETDYIVSGHPSSGDRQPFVGHPSSSTIWRRSSPSTVKWWTCVVTAGLGNRPRQLCFRRVQWAQWCERRTRQSADYAEQW